MKPKITLLIFALFCGIATVLAQPVADFSWTGTGCSSPMVFTDLSTNATSTNISWFWDFGDGATSFTQNPTHQYGSPGVYQVSLYVMDNNTVTDTVTLAVTVSCLQFEIFENCVLPGATYTLTSNVHGGVPPYIFNGVGVSGGSTWVAPSTPGQYVLVCIDAVGVPAYDTITVGAYFDTYTQYSTCGNANGIAGVNVDCAQGNVTYQWSPSGATTSEITNVVPGIYSVIVSDTYTTDTLQVEVLDSCGTISGQVYVDLNQNNIKDVNEPPYSSGNINITGSQAYNIQVNSNGHYSATVAAGNLVTNFNPYTGYYTVNPLNHASTISSSTPHDTIDFALHFVPGNPDLQIFLIPQVSARPGFNATYLLNAKNVGTDTLSGYIRFIKDPIVNVVSTNPYRDVEDADTLGWYFSDFPPLSISSYLITLNVPVPPTVNVGDILNYSVQIEPINGDVTPQNNFDDLTQTVIGSYDPNDKWVSNEIITPVQVTNAEYLDYRIRFQNTGTDTAFTVVVRDTLSSNLDWNSLQMISTSHEYTLTISDQNKLSWRFDNILLVDSTTNEPASHGYIMYRIKPKTSLVVNDNIPNSASIYFDYNLPIVTNTANTVVDNITSVTYGSEEGSISIYPNPSNGEFTINFTSKTTGTYNQELSDISGRIVYSKSFQHNGTTILNSQSQLAPGVYSLNITGENGKWVQKVVVK